jgi:hypothetical protein
MAIDFSAIKKIRVQFVPYVQPAGNAGKSALVAAATGGQKAKVRLSSVSDLRSAGQSGQGWTQATLEAMRRLSSYHRNEKPLPGHDRHAGHAILPEDVLFFDERAAMRQFDGGQPKAEAEEDAFAEWMAERAARTFH